MSAHMTSPVATPPERKPGSRAAWIALALSPIVFAVVMETVEAMSMNGWFSIDTANLVFVPVMVLIPGTVVALGVRALRRGSRLAWVPTIVGGLGVLFFLGLAVLQVLESLGVTTFGP